MEKQYLISWSRLSWIWDQDFPITQRALITLYNAATQQNFGSVETDEDVTGDAATSTNIILSNVKTEQQNVEEDDAVDVVDVVAMSEGTQTTLQDPTQVHQPVTYFPTVNTITKNIVESRKKQFVKGKCGTCGRMFKNPNNLKRHELVHSGERPYACSTCKKKFKQKHNLIEHENIHTGTKPHICKICSKAFIWKSSLVKHEQRVHSGALLYTSSTCSIHSLEIYRCSKCYMAHYTLHSLFNHQCERGVGIFQQRSLNQQVLIPRNSTF